MAANQILRVGYAVTSTCSKRLVIAKKRCYLPDTAASTIADSEGVEDNGYRFD